MKYDHDVSNDRNFRLFAGQSTLATVAWMMASPSIVMTFLAVALGMPIWLIGALVTIRQTANSLTDVFLFDAITRIRNRKLALSISDLALALCFGAAIVAVLFGSKSQTMVVFVVCVFVMGIIDEFQQLLLTDFVGDNLNSRSRLTLQYTQMALGGGITVALTWLAHEMTHALPPMHRHSIVVAIAIFCFALSACAVLAVRDSASRTPAQKSGGWTPIKALSDYFSNMYNMLQHAWFRKFIVLRIVFACVVLSVPFFSILSAEAHHASNRGLTALIISFALGYIVAGPLWGALNKVSHRLVLVSCALLVGFSGMALALLHLLDMAHDVRIHAAAMFTVSVAVRGIGAVLKLYYMDVAPKDQRVTGIAVARSLARFAMIILSASLAAVAHMHETVWAIIFITVASLAAAIFGMFLTRGSREGTASDQVNA